ncbi:RHS repeat-associated core domain-containing protein, partial [Paenibacillus sp. IHBB 3054]|uniref:RHS repeat-associated core domain-containing protein n=1 Tax=Paenibacillus sp. IHBB 3054 TaxID=3425689 RepID=UPI003F66CC6A
QTSSYGYDPLNRLVSITRPDGSRIAYTYDVRGNRQTLSDTSNASPDTTDTSYTYDLQNTLTGVSKGGKATSFQYYADGMRYLKTNGNTQTQVNYNFQGQVISEEKIVSGVFVEQANFVRGDRVLVKKDKKASKDYYYLYNGHGDVVQIVNTNGEVVNNYTYDEWGNIISQVEGTSNSFKYTGEVYDTETGLYYLRARYYDPSIGRFLNEDTVEGQIDNPLSQNLYTYVHNNPLIYTDPTGHDAQMGGASGGNPLYNLSNTNATRQVISARSVDTAAQAKILNSLIKEYKYGFFGDDSGGMTRNQFEYLYKMALAEGSSNYNTAKWAISQLDSYFSYGANDKTIAIATTIGVMGAGSISGGGGFKRNIKTVADLTPSSFGSLTNNGVIKVNASGSNRPLTGNPNSYYSTVNGEHVFVYDNNGKLIYDLSNQRVKAFKINVSPNGTEHYQPYKLDGPVPDFIKDLFGW